MHYAEKYSAGTTQANNVFRASVSGLIAKRQTAKNYCLRIEKGTHDRQSYSRCHGENIHGSSGRADVLDETTKLVLLA